MEVPTGPNGKPVEYFLVDPPQRIDRNALGLSPIGVTLFPDPQKVIETAGGIKQPLMHVVDWVGEQHYPNVADFVEEVRCLGVSRKIARTTDFAGLGPGSRLYLAHAKAYIENWPEYDERIESLYCPKGLAEHRPRARPPDCCAGLWWHDVEGGEFHQDHRYHRHIAEVEYLAEPPPKGVKAKWALAMFAIFPLVKVAVIRAADGSHEVTEHAARQGRLPVTVEDA